MALEGVYSWQGISLHWLFATGTGTQACLCQLFILLQTIPPSCQNLGLIANKIPHVNGTNREEIGEIRIRKSLSEIELTPRNIVLIVAIFIKLLMFKTHRTNSYFFKTILSRADNGQ